MASVLAPRHRWLGGAKGCRILSNMAEGQKRIPQENKKPIVKGKMSPEPVVPAWSFLFDPKPYEAES